LTKNNSKNNINGGKYMFENIDFKNCKILYKETTYYKKEDLLQLECTNGKIIDVGWYGKENKYCIYVIKNYDWENPCYKITNQPKMEHVNNWLEKIINHETSIFEPNLKNLYSKLEDTINNYVANNYNKSIKILEQLCDNGTSLKELKNHLLIYSLKYYETDEGKYNFICDLLDIITINYDGKNIK
jgi:hypothetical protein